MNYQVIMNNATSATLNAYENDILVSSEPCKLTKDTLAFELPANELGRKWIMVSKLTKHGGKLDLTPHIDRVITNVAERKGLEEYLEGDDKALYLQLVAKAKANREAANKKQPMSAIEKAQRALERAQAKLNELTKA